MMNFLIAMDSFKGCLGSVDAGHAVANGLKRVFADAEVVVCPIADGGEGTIDALVHADNAHKIYCHVEGPYRDMVKAMYLRLPGQLAVIEMAQAAGLYLSSRREPLYASTYGVGMMIRHAIETGCRHLMIGIGGSATNDGGAGMLQALGFRLLDNQDIEIERGAIGLKSLVSIDESNTIPHLADCIFHVACDVTVPLLGPNGCSFVFGPQKGATTQNAYDMDLWLSHYAAIAQISHPEANPDAPGAGAAGGLGFALNAFCHARLERGLPLIANIVNLEEKIRAADFIITGEGKIDAQTLMGKVPVGIASIAKKYNKPVIALTGSLDVDLNDLYSNGINAVLAIQKGPCSLEKSMQSEIACKNLSDTAEQIARLIHLSK
jgi:glycerate kinase